jgi:HEAT repeat protein
VFGDETAATGPDGFRRARAALGGDDAYDLAALALLFLGADTDPGKLPWTEIEGERALAQQRAAAPPAIDGDALVFWVWHERLADLNRVTVDLTSLTLTSQLGGQVLAEAIPALDRARAGLASANQYARLGALKLLDEVDDADAALALLHDALANDAVADVRLLAATALGPRGAAASVDPLARALLNDADPRVRRVAAESLGAIGDARAAQWLQRSADLDGDASVKAASQAALAAVGAP